MSHCDSVLMYCVGYEKFLLVLTQPYSVAATSYGAERDLYVFFQDTPWHAIITANNITAEFEMNHPNHISSKKPK